MSVVEEIRAAIEKLNGIRSECGEVIANEIIPAVFFRTDDDTDEDGERFSYGVEIAVEEPEFARSIETLFRTIDAQIAILNEAQVQMMSRERLGLPLNTGPIRALALARAINWADRTVTL